MVEQARRKRLQAESRQLKQANATLEAARQKAEADKKRAEQGTQVMAALTGNLLEPNLKVPQSLSEAASLMGQNLADTAKSKQKWGDSVPVTGAPADDEYAREQDALVTQSAALMKFLSDDQNAALLKQPNDLAQFQSESLTGGLNLRDDQAQVVNAALNGYYQQFLAQGLNTDARPETGLDAWNQQRLALGEQAYASIQALLTPEQSAAFHSIYPHAGTYVFVVSFGGLPGVTVTP